MGSVTFNSVDGQSRVHDHVVTEIREIKDLCEDDDDVVLSLCQGFFFDYIWIAGGDRQYFADRIRSVLATEPTGEVTTRGTFVPQGSSGIFKGTPFDREPGLHSVIEHLEASSEHPIVITNSVTADFPYYNFVPGFDDLEGEEAEDVCFKSFDALSVEEQWKVVWPEFEKKYASWHWRPGTNAGAWLVREKMREAGVWPDRHARNELEAALMSAADVEGLQNVVGPTISGLLRIEVSRLRDEDSIYAAAIGRDFRAVVEPFAQEVESKLAGIALVDVSIDEWSRSEYGRNEVRAQQGFVELPSREKSTMLVGMSVLSSADELLCVVKTLAKHVEPSKLVVVAALVNGPQADIARRELASQPFPVAIIDCEVVDHSLIKARKHLEEVDRLKPFGNERYSPWVRSRMRDQALEDSRRRKEKAPEDTVG